MRSRNKKVPEGKGLKTGRGMGFCSNRSSRSSFTREAKIKRLRKRFRFRQRLKRTNIELLQD